MTRDRRFTACSACRRQYDVTDHHPGQQIRCGCGEMMEVVHHRPHSPRPVRCVSCGASLAQGATACSYCATEVTVDERRLGSVCPLCYARMPGDARFCPECGVTIAPQRIHPIPEGACCPRCETDLVSRVVGPTNVIECPACHGLWIERESFERVVKDAEQRQGVEDALGASRGDAPAELVPDEVRYLECVVCGQLMNRRNFALSSGVIIDLCRSHGVWLDARELNRILQFVRAGGLTKAREREERERERKRKLDRMRREDASTYAGTAGPVGGYGYGGPTSFGSGGSLGILAIIESLGRTIGGWFD